LSSDRWVGPRASPNTYRLVELLGGGGEGDVWLATVRLSEQGRSRVAVKIMAATGEPDEERRFTEFGMLLQSLTHPNLVRVQAVFVGPAPHLAEAADTAGLNRYVVMDYVEGRTLAEWVEEHPASSAEERLRLLLPVAAALDAMHRGATTEIPVAHGDIKPANIVVRAGDGPVLVDLGLVRLIDAAGASGRSAAYTPPERRGDDLSATPESDRWAFLVTVAQTLTGALPPLDAEGFLDLAALEEHLRTRPTTRRRPILVRRVLAALRAAPEDRPPALHVWLTAAIDALSQITDPGPPPSEAELGPRSADAPTSAGLDGAALPSRRRLRPAWVVAAAVGAVIVAVGALLLYRAADQPVAPGPTPITVATADPNRFDWNALPPLPNPGEPLFAQALTRHEPGWPVGATTSVSRSFTSAGYAVSAQDRRYADYVTAPAPKTTFISDSTVSAAGALQGGQGLWGCGAGARIPTPRRRTCS
jgi:serine/threonine protein kinase